MRVRSTIIALAVSGLALGSSVANGHQTQGEDPGGGICGDEANMTVIAPGAETLYIDAREVSADYSIWIYMESNGHPGMQTDKDAPNFVTQDPADRDNCSTSGHNSIEPDSLIF